MPELHSQDLDTLHNIDYFNVAELTLTNAGEIVDNFASSMNKAPKSCKPGKPGSPTGL